MQAPTAPLAGRYRFKSKVQAALKAPTWLAIDETTGEEVVASALPTARVAALMGVVGLKHANLASILQVVDAPSAAELPDGTPEGAAVVVAEFIPGKTLHQYLKTSRMTPAEAVTLWIRLCRAAATLHASGGAHGAISPRSIVIEPKGARTGPVLTQLLAATSGAYCAPERLQGRGPSSSDDTWALHAALFAALTGTSPYRGDTKDQLLQAIVSGQVQRLNDFGVGDTAMQELLQAGLVANLARRRTTIEQFVEALENWEPASLSAQASEWEEDAATVVGDDSEAMALAMRIDANRPKPGESLPPVPVGDDDGPTLAEPPKRPPAPRPQKPATIPRAAAPAAPRPPEPEPPAAPPAPAVPEPPVFAPEPPLATQPLGTQPLATEPMAEQPAEPEIPAPYDEPNPYDDEDDATTVMGGEEVAGIRAVLGTGDSDAPSGGPLPAAGAPPPTYPQTPFDQPPPPPPPPMDAGAVQPGYPPPQGFEQPQPGYPPQQPQGFPAPDAQGAYPQPDAQGFYPQPDAQGPYLPSVPAPSMDLQVAALDESEIRKASRGPMIALVAIVVVLALLIGVLLFLNYQGVITMGPFSPARVAATTSAPTTSASATAVRTASRPEPSSSAAQAVAVAAAPETAGHCVATHFETGSLSDSEDYAFLCRDDDLRGINSQLYRRLVVQGAGKVTSGMREWSTLGWFELAVTAVIRAGCCDSDVAAPKLPKTAPGCDQLSEVLAKVARHPIEKGQGETRANAYDDAVVCLFKRGIPRPYNYMARPTSQARRTFAAFLERAATRAKT